MTETQFHDELIKLIEQGQKDVSAYDLGTVLSVELFKLSEIIAYEMRYGIDKERVH